MTVGRFTLTIAPSMRQTDRAGRRFYRPRVHPLRGPRGHGWIVTAPFLCAVFMVAN